MIVDRHHLLFPGRKVLKLRKRGVSHQSCSEQILPFGPRILFSALGTMWMADGLKCKTLLLMLH